jgi:hypothetical protein
VTKKSTLNTLFSGSPNRGELNNSNFSKLLAWLGSDIKPFMATTFLGSAYNDSQRK